MGNKKKKKTHPAMPNELAPLSATIPHHPPPPLPPSPVSPVPRHRLSALLTQPDIRYKILVLIHDLRSISKDHTSGPRLSSTIHPLYISAPYFSDSEAATVLGALVDVRQPEGTRPLHLNGPLHDAHDDQDASDERSLDRVPTASDSTSDPVPDLPAEETVEQTLHSRLEKFLTKRRASGDARPCGPHDLAPVYQAVFNISRAEIEDERFLGRVRRYGLRIGRP